MILWCFIATEKTQIEFYCCFVHFNVSKLHGWCMLKERHPTYVHTYTLFCCARMKEVLFVSDVLTMSWDQTTLRKTIAMHFMLVYTDQVQIVHPAPQRSIWLESAIWLKSSYLWAICPSCMGLYTWFPNYGQLFLIYFGFHFTHCFTFVLYLSHVLVSEQFYLFIVPSALPTPPYIIFPTTILSWFQINHKGFVFLPFHIYLLHFWVMHIPFFCSLLHSCIDLSWRLQYVYCPVE